jgi:uracil-DNA glycosylase
MPNPTIILGEAYGANEERLGIPFVGSSGVELIRMLGESGFLILTERDRNNILSYYNTSDPAHIASIWRAHPEVACTNVFNLHPLANDVESLCGPKPSGIPGYPILAKSKYVRAEFEPHLDRLASFIIDRDPNLIICLGNTPLWALAGRTGITKWRGTTIESTHTVSGYKLLPTYHPAAILRQWDNRPIVIADLMKASREAFYPEIRRPYREVWIEPTVEDIIRFTDEEIYSPSCQLLSVDIETSGTRITCIGLSPKPDLALVIPFDDERSPSGSYWSSAKDERLVWLTLARVLEDRRVPKLFQNGLYDIAFLWRSMRIKVLGAEEDTMLMSHALQPESLKGLAFLGSIYTDEGAWKAEFRAGRSKARTIKKGS